MGHDMENRMMVHGQMSGVDMPTLTVRSYTYDGDFVLSV